MIPEFPERSGNFVREEHGVRTGESYSVYRAIYVDRGVHRISIAVQDDIFESMTQEELDAYVAKVVPRSKS